MKRALLSLSLVLFVPSLALAQAPMAESSGGGGGGGAGRGLGVGAEQTLAGVRGAAIVWDAGQWHVDGILGYQHFSLTGDDASAFAIGGRFFWNLHQTSQSDFGLGGGLTLIQSDAGGNNSTDINLEVAAQIRMFIVPNVALSASAGLALLMLDDNSGNFAFGGFTGANDNVIVVDGQVLAALGITYFFQ